MLIYISLLCGIFSVFCLKAIKLAPFKWEPIYQLGNYYKYLLKDHKKALKCYQKSYELCQNLELCGLELVDCLLHEKEDV